jgi:hypothetical protein
MVGACRKARRAVPYLPGGARTDLAAGIERRGPAPAVTQQIVDRALKACGMREPARAARQCRHRHDSTHTKAPHLQQVHRTVLQPLHPEHVEVERWRADAPEGRQGRSAERDERGTPCAAQPIRAGDGTPWLFPRPKVSLWVCTTAGPGLWGTQSAAGARWQHALFHRRLGRLRATWGGGAPYDNAQHDAFVDLD